MRWMLRLVWVLAGLFVLLVFAGQALPKEFRVERSIETSASAGRIHALATNPANWTSWLGPPQGLEIVEDEPGLGMAYERRDSEGEIVQRGALRYEALEENLLVTWVVAGEFGSSPYARYRALFVERDEGPRLELGLARLAALAESLPEPPSEPDSGSDQPAEP